MGNFYVNYTLRGIAQEAAARVLAGRKSIVSPPVNDTVVVFDEESDEQDQVQISWLATSLSDKLRCPVLAILNHDDDILWYQLYVNGELEDEYDSTPGYFDDSAGRSAPAGGDAAKLCDAFGSARIEDVERILRRSSFEEDGYVFAYERHADLVDALGISAFGICTAYENFENHELPDGLTFDQIVRTA